MSHFAEIDADNKVIRVLVGDNSMLNEGYDWLIENLGGTWIKTSYNKNIRFNYAGIGYTYDAVRDAFIAPEPEGNLGLDEATCQWIMPVVERG
jgi:hypothetical protein